MRNEQERQRVLAIIDEHNEGASSLIQVLNSIQEEIGCLSRETQQLVARTLRLPFSRVAEVTSFYSLFTIEPKGKHEISVCLGTACFVKGANTVLEELKKALAIEEKQTTTDGLFTLSTCRCIGACALAPAITINKKVRGMMNAEKVSEILELYRCNGSDGDGANDPSFDKKAGQLVPSL